MAHLLNDNPSWVIRSSFSVKLGLDYPNSVLSESYIEIPTTQSFIIFIPNRLATLFLLVIRYHIIIASLLRMG